MNFLTKTIHKITLFSIGLLGLVTVAQERENERIKALHIAHITEELNLTAKEAEKFWPVYNAYHDERKSLHKKERAMIREKMSHLSVLSESECWDLLALYLEQRSKKCEISESLARQLTGILPTKKILLLFRSEARFRRHLLQQYGQRKRAIDYRKEAIEEHKHDREAPKRQGFFGD